MDEGTVDGHILDSDSAGRRFLRGGGLRLLAFAAGLLVGLAATPLVVHHLGVVRWGDYGKVGSLLFIVSALTEGGLGQMGVREFSVGPSEGHRQFLRELLGLRIALTLSGLIGAVVFGLVADWGTVVVLGVTITGLGALLTSIQITLAVPLATTLRLGWMALFDFVPQFASALIMLMLVVSGAGLLPFFFASVAGSLASLAMTVWLVRSEVTFLPTLAPRRWRELLRQTFFYAIATAAGAIYFRISLVATSLLSTPRQTGLFALGFRVLELSAVVPFLLVSSAFPILVRSAFNDVPRLRYALERLSEGALILGGWFALCLIFGAPFAVHVLAAGSSSFAGSVPVLRILGGAIAATFLLATFSYTLLSLQMYRQLVILNLGIVVLALIASPVLISPHGAVGAAMLTLLLEITLTVGYAVALFSARPDLRPALGRAGRIALAVGLAALLGLVLDPHPVIAVCAVSAALWVSLFALRAVPAELLQAARRSAAVGPN